MRSNRIVIIITALMCAASVGAVLLRPDTKLAQVAPFSLEKIIPKQFGDWREVAQEDKQVFNPETQALMSKLYSQIISRTYVDSSGYEILLSVAYGADQRGSLQVHKPEICYPAQGFNVVRNEECEVPTPFGLIPARRLFTEMETRQEPVTYWFTAGDTAVRSVLQKRLTDLRYGLTGVIPDGLIFRVSSLDSDQVQANRHHDQFVSQLMQAIPPAARKRLGGLGA